MNDLLPVKVECYSGHKADEYPVRFYLNEIRVEIAEILDRWYQYDDAAEFPAANYYKIRTKEHQEQILKHETESDRWYLWIKGECVNL